MRSIESLGDLKEFCRRLAWIGKMDYALGFFERLADVALQKVTKELCGVGSKTGWIHSPSINGDEQYRYQIQAQFFADNYAATVVQILSYLLFREKSIDQVRNIEFSDTRERLTSEKVEKILTLEGPFRSRRSTQLILKTIYVF